MNEGEARCTCMGNEGSAYDNCWSSDNFQVNLLCDQPCADLFGENVKNLAFGPNVLLEGSS